MAYRHQQGVYDPKFHSNRQRRELEDMLGEWYGTKAAAQEITSRTAPAQKLSDLLDELMEKHVNPAALALIELRNNWEQLIGAPLNKFTALATVKDHTAYIEVSHPAFLMELKRNNVSEKYLQILKDAAPALEITAINFVPAGGYSKNSN